MSLHRWCASFTQLELQLLQTEVNHTEVAVQQLVALLHCRALNKVSLQYHAALREHEDGK